jgi:hypothetical protein
LLDRAAALHATEVFRICSFWIYYYRSFSTLSLIMLILSVNN